MTSGSVETAPSRRSPPGLVVAAATIVVFFIADAHDFFLFRLFASQTEGWARVGALAALRWAPQALLVALAAAVLFGPRRVAEAMGVNRSPLVGLAFGLGVTAVMAAALAATSPLASSEGLGRDLVRSAALPGLGEELWYRAFLFGFLFRYAGWGFLPAALLGALIFGGAHLYQGGAPGEAAAIFAITALGGLWFAWLYAEWEFNIWVPVSVHLLMNAWWEVFAVSDTALGPMAANLSRLAVIVISIAVTVWAARSRGGRVVRGRAWIIGGPAARGA